MTMVRPDGTITGAMSVSFYRAHTVGLSSNTAILSIAIESMFLEPEFDVLLSDSAVIRSLPSFVYTSSEVFETELERIFYSKWLVICHESQIKNKGDVRVQKIGSKSIFVIRGQDDKIRAFYNVCRHRGAKLLSDSTTNLRVIQCGYHAWSYKLDGKLAGCPDRQEFENFSDEDYSLFGIKLELWGGFVWSNLDPKSASLKSYLGDFCERFDKYKMEELRWTASVGRYEVDANWKSIMENANECYHCPTVHPETLGPYYRQVVPYAGDAVKGPYVYIVWKEYTRTDGNAVVQSKQLDSAKSLGLDENLGSAMPFPTVYPTTQFVITADWVASFIAWPVNVRKTVVLIDLFYRVPPNENEIKEVTSYLDLVNSQDFAITRVQQEGLESGVFQGCEFNSLEKSVRHFQKMYLDSMKGNDGVSFAVADRS